MDPAAPIDQPFERTIGRLVMNFGALELELMRATALLAAEDPAFDLDAKVAHFFGKILVDFDKVARTKIDADRPLLGSHESLMKRLRNVGETRNYMGHWGWLDIPGIPLDLGKGKLTERDIKWRDVLAKRQVKVVSPSEIADAGNRIHALIGDFRVHLAAICRVRGTSGENPVS
jgi:hypothetical protein